MWRSETVMEAYLWFVRLVGGAAVVFDVRFRFTIRAHDTISRQSYWSFTSNEQKFTKILKPDFTEYDLIVLKLQYKPLVSDISV